MEEPGDGNWGKASYLSFRFRCRRVSRLPITRYIVVTADLLYCILLLYCSNSDRFHALYCSKSNRFNRKLEEKSDRTEHLAINKDSSCWDNIAGGAALG